MQNRPIERTVQYIHELPQSNKASQQFFLVADLQANNPYNVKQRASKIYRSFLREAEPSHENIYVIAIVLVLHLF